MPSLLNNDVDNLTKKEADTLWIYSGSMTELRPLSTARFLGSYTTVD